MMLKANKNLVLLCLLVLLVETTLGVVFKVQDQYSCRDTCIDRNYHYFADVDKKTGICCSSDENWESQCYKQGLDTTQQEDNYLRYFTCPTGPRCGALDVIATRTSKIYTLNTNVIDPLENYCNHEIKFSIDAGFNDIMKVDILSAPPGTKVTFQAGNTFADADGLEITEDLTDKLIRVGFPNSLFITVQHTGQEVDEADQLFAFEFWYQDIASDDFDKAIEESFEVFILNNKTKGNANLTWVYIVGGVVVICLLVAAVIVYNRVQSEQKVQEDVQIEREKGLVPLWGSKVNHNFADNDTTQQSALQDRSNNLSLVKGAKLVKSGKDQRVDEDPIQIYGALAQLQ